ncbi:DNA polymerase III subunit [Patescibacteria group bacterium]|nr:DNA polymerase III subunit [Patescibacteria group bacterium]
MVDHQKQWQFLKKSAELGKLPHALLFYGQEGLGKKALAIEFSKFLIGKISPPDFILIESEGKEIQIAQIRELIGKLSFKPYLADFKIAVLNNAHLMTQEAQNCFLKFLEEPKGKTILILVTAYPSLLLPTIISRVQKVRFFPTKGFEVENNEEFISDLIKISESDLVSRFQYAKDISTENLKEILDTWLRYFRRIFISRLTGRETKDFSQYSLTKLKDIIRHIQSTKFLIFTTNTNSRLALEILLMEM